MRSVEYHFSHVSTDTARSYPFLWDVKDQILLKIACLDLESRGKADFKVGNEHPKIPRWVAPPVLRHIVQLLGRVRLFATPWTAARQASLSLTISQLLLLLSRVSRVRLCATP